MKPKCLVCGGDCNDLNGKLECYNCGSTFPFNVFHIIQNGKHCQGFTAITETKPSEQTPHQLLVEKFMQGAKQEIPDNPCIPNYVTRMLRASLIFEEALELIDALGVRLQYHFSFNHGECILCDLTKFSDYTFSDKGNPILKDILDGCVDLRVVTTGTLSACGIKDAHPQYLQDMNNLEKIEKGTIREDGKLVKPPGHQPPDWDKEIERQSKLS